MMKNKDANNLKAGDMICLFKKDGLLPIACGFLEYFDEKYDKVYLNIDERSVELTTHLYDFVSTSALNDLGPRSSLERLRQQYMQFSGVICESKR